MKRCKFNFKKNHLLRTQTVRSNSLLIRSWKSKRCIYCRFWGFSQTGKERELGRLSHREHRPSEDILSKALWGLLNETLPYSPRAVVLKLLCLAYHMENYICLRSILFYLLESWLENGNKNNNEHQIETYIYLHLI